MNAENEIHATTAPRLISTGATIDDVQSLVLAAEGMVVCWKYGHFETPTMKTDILTFLDNKRIFARTTYIRLFIYLNAIYGQKNEGNRFFNSCHSMVDISWPSLLNNEFHIINCKGKNSLGPGSLVGKKRQKTGWKGVQKQLASERSEPSGGLAKGKGRRLFPIQVPRSARLARFFTLSILFFAFYPTKEPGPRLGEKFKQKGDRRNLCSRKKSWKKIQAYTGFKYFTYAIRVLHQYQSMVQILWQPELFQAFFCCTCTCKDLLCIQNNINLNMQSTFVGNMQCCQLKEFWQETDLLLLP